MANHLGNTQPIAISRVNISINHENYIGKFAVTGLLHAVGDFLACFQSRHVIDRW